MSVATLLLLLAVEAPIIAEAPSGDIGCDPTHPARFTTIEGRTESLFTAPEEAVIFKPEPLDHGACPKLETAANLGRFRTSERGELVFRFDPSLVRHGRDYLGRLDVRGTVIDDGVAREIEIPGYREIGKQVTAANDQAAEIEGVVADAIALVAAAELASNTDTGASYTKGTSAWLLGDFYQNETKFRKVFTNIVSHPDLFREAKNGSPLRDILQLSHLGINALDSKSEVLPLVAASVAEAESTQDERAWAADYAAVTDRVQRFFTKAKHAYDFGQTSRTDPNASNNVGKRYCNFSIFDDTCADLRALEQLLDGQSSTAIPAPTTIADVERLYGEVRESNLSVQSKLATVRRQRLSDAAALKPAALLSACRAAVCNEAIKVPPHVVAFRNQLYDLLDAEYARMGARDAEQHKPARAKEDTAWIVDAVRDMAHAIRQLALDEAGWGWREDRIQPKAIGAEAGDVIEVVISYLPPGAPGKDGTSTVDDVTGSRRPARWTTRFLVERQGFYLDAGASLDLVTSFEYAPRAAGFRGAQGSLVPGVRADFTYAAQPEINNHWDLAANVVAFVVPGAGLELNYLDFDTTKPVEIGLQAHAVLLARIFTLGVGYNFTPDDPRLTGRNVYWSVGLGVDQVFDVALTTAESLSR